jgi:hypothetical protein
MRLAGMGALQIQVQNRQGETRYVDLDTIFGMLVATWNPNSGRTPPPNPVDPDDGVERVHIWGDGGIWSYAFVPFDFQMYSLVQKSTGEKTVQKELRISKDTLFRFLQECIDELWGSDVKLKYLSPSSQGVHGMATFTYQSAISDNGNKYTFTANIINDTTSFTIKQIGQIHRYGSPAKSSGYYKDPPGALGTTLPKGTWVTSQGIKELGPYTNYTASNTDQGGHYFAGLTNLIGAFVDTQIHELGNSIAFITGVFVGDPNNEFDSDSGQALEACVARKLGDLKIDAVRPR